MHLRMSPQQAPAMVPGRKERPKIRLSVLLSVCGGATALGTCLSGCVEGFDSANGTDKAYFRLYDYTIDRPRVLGIRYTPLDLSSGDTVTFEALGATPDRFFDVSVEWWGCGTSVATPFSYYGADCLDTSIAEYLGQGTAVTITMPVYDTSSCADTGCYGFFPVMAVLREQGQATGYGVTYLIPDYLNQQPPLVFDLNVADIQFTVGQGATGTPSVTARPGERVPLRVDMETVEVDYTFSWYVTAGTLESLGVTHATSLQIHSGPQRNLLRTDNALVIPEDFEGDEIGVYVVIDSNTYYYPGLEQFRVGRIQVQR